MSRLTKWTISTEDLMELFEKSFGQRYGAVVDYVDFDEQLGMLTIEILEEEDGREHMGQYIGIDLR